MRLVLDEKGRPIEVGDVLKVFHFIGARRKRHYMYKWVCERNGELYALHLSKRIGREAEGYFLWTMAESDFHVLGTEIVQTDNMEKLK